MPTLFGFRLPQSLSTKIRTFTSECVVIISLHTNLQNSYDNPKKKSPLLRAGILDF